MQEEQNLSGDQTLEAAAPTEIESKDIQPEQQQTVPLSALQSERSERQRLQDELKMMKEHVSLLNSTKANPQEKPQDVLDGLQDIDVMTVGEFKKVSEKLTNDFNQKLSELKVAQKNSDYQEVVEKYLPEVLKHNPGLRQTLEQTQDHNLAYHLAKNSDAYRNENQKSQKSHDAQRIVENSQKAGALSSMGSTSPVSQAQQYKQMSDKDFASLANRHMG